MPKIAELHRPDGISEISALIRQYCEPLPPLEDEEEFGAKFDRFGDAKVVLLGEATHGSSEFYRARAAITRRLIKRYGFDLVAVEADWPDAARIDRHVRHRVHQPAVDEAFTRFPMWMWRNVEVHDFVEWLRGHNIGLDYEQRVQFAGLDIYSLTTSISAVLSYLDDVDPEEAARARLRYGCLTPWQDDPARYGKATYRLEKPPCEDKIVAQLQTLLAKRLIYMKEKGDFFDAEQNARIIHAAEYYYRLMYRSATESWNLRDRHMFGTLTRLLHARGAASKAIVWAHNSHIGNAAATAMGWQGEFNLGELCRASFGRDAVLIGFGTDHGTVAAADDWGDPMQIKTVRPARTDSWEYGFHKSGISTCLMDWRTTENAELLQAFAEPRLERAIGVVYRPETELTSHYFKSILKDQFDAYLWFDETKAVTPLSRKLPDGAADTYPFGL